MKDNENTAPKTACVFNEHNAIQFAAGEGEKANSFTIVGYSGDVIEDHWYWGNLAFDLEGIKFAKARTPVLEEHFTSSRIGFTTSQQIEGNVTVKGRFLDNDVARQMSADIKSGFPMEASLYVQPSVIERIDEGESVEVNGLQLKGPGTVFRKAAIKEVSMCVFGADSATKSVAAADRNNLQVHYTFIDKEKSMSKKKESTQEEVAEMTLDAFKTDHQVLYETIAMTARNEGAASEQARFAELREACGEDYALTVACFAEGKSIIDAMKMRTARAEAKAAELAEQLAATKKADIDPAIAEFSDTSTSQDTKKFDEATATDEQLTEHFTASQEIQDEFSSAAAYVAAVHADRKDR